jgi:geranylgeranyl pyrophosphate synthase
MARAEVTDIKLSSLPQPLSRDKFWKIKTQATDVETCMKIGAILGGGSQKEIANLGKFGGYLGILMELWKDFHVSTNLTLELNQKIKNKALPFAVIWASEHSDNLKRKLQLLSNKKDEMDYTKQVVKDFLDTGALQHVFGIMEKAAKDGVASLSKLKINRPSIQTLQSFIEAQPGLFLESLPASKVKEESVI